MNSVQALDFAIRRLVIDRNHFVHTEAHNECLETLIALKQLIEERAQRSNLEVEV